jgi:hypothetical protein
MKTLQRDANLKTAPQDIKLTTVKAVTKRPNTLFRFERPDYDWRSPAALATSRRFTALRSKCSRKSRNAAVLGKYYQY